MPGARNKALAEKRTAQQKLTELRRVSMTFEASEEFLSRLAALLTFATVPYELDGVEVAGPLPWEDPTDPRFQKPPELEIDYNAVRNSIMKLMTQWLTTEKRPRDELEAIIVSHGAPKLSELSKDGLLSLHQDLSHRLNPKEPE